MILLSDNFSLNELIRSATAARKGILNQPNAAEIRRLTMVARNVLQPVRDKFGPTTVNSGFRCLELNRAIGSKDTSQHVLGEAVDFEVPGVSNFAVAKWIRDNLEFDQLILEFYEEELGPDSGWVHCSFKESGNRNSVLTINRKGTFQGLV